MHKKEITGFVWVFPPQSPLYGQKCIVFHDFDNHKDYASCLNQSFEATIRVKGQPDAEGCFVVTCPCRIMTFGCWFSKERCLYGICMPINLAGVAQITDFATVILGQVL